MTIKLSLIMICCLKTWGWHLLGQSGICRGRVASVEAEWHLLGQSGICWDRVASVGSEWHLLRQSGICWDRVPPSGFQTSGGSQGTMEEGYGGVGGSRCLACGEISK